MFGILRDHRTAVRCTSFHGFPVAAIFYPDFYLRRQCSRVEMLYLLVTAAKRGGRPECATSLPSWSYGFDSRRPLSSSVRRLRELRQHLRADGGPFAPEGPDFLETEYRVKMKRGGVILPGHVEHRLGTGEGSVQAGRGRRCPYAWESRGGWRGAGVSASRACSRSRISSGV